VWGTRLRPLTSHQPPPHHPLLPLGIKVPLPLRPGQLAGDSEPGALPRAARYTRHGSIPVPHSARPCQPQLTRQTVSGRAVSRALWRAWPWAGLVPGHPGPGGGLREQAV
jgi:hypothetical protein